MEVFNVVQNLFKPGRLRTLKDGTTVILIYDTDVNHIDVLKKNLKLLNSLPAVKDVYCIPQVYNLEDAIVQACNIKNAHDLTHSATKTDFKRDVIRCTNLGKRLSDCNFNKSQLWKKGPNNKFKQFGNDSDKIKL